VVVSFPLTPGEVAWISDEDADLARLSWQRSTHGHLQRNLRSGFGLRSNQDLARTIIERLLARSLTAADIVEHVDGDLLNNTRENLRLLGKSALRKPRSAQAQQHVGLHRGVLRAEAATMESLHLAAGQAQTPRSIPHGYPGGFRL
jgi:hypothetical protein